MEIQKEHKKQITKFGMYGFLKNLKLFEPLLFVYLLSIEPNFILIGTLYAIREAIILIFEIPSGVLADKYGKKNQLYLCFSFYILSFVMFFIGGSFLILVVAFIFYGFGEAFRSGTHKAMIMDYLEEEEIHQSKSRVYGKTRSFSMYGSMISSILAAVFVFIVPEIRFLFLFAIIPYVIDMLLISSYPSYMNNQQNETYKFKEFLGHNVTSLKYIINDKKLLKTLVDAASFQAFFKTLKDYIQPIILISSFAMLHISGVTVEENNRIYLGGMYAVIFLFSAISTRNAYRLQKHFDKHLIVNSMWLLFSTCVILISVFFTNPVIVFVLFILIYIALNFRKPYMVEAIGNLVAKNEKASVLSVESQISSIIIMIVAPLLGVVIELYSIRVMFLVLGIILSVISVLSILRYVTTHK